MAEKTPTTKKKAPKYEVTIDINEKTHSLKGDVLEDVLNSFEAPLEFFTNVIVSVKSGDKDIIEYISALKARALFTNKDAVTLLADKLTQALE